MHDWKSNPNRKLWSVFDQTYAKNFFKMIADTTTSNKPLLITSQALIGNVCITFVPIYLQKPQKKV